MNKFTKVIAAAAVIAAVLSCAACSKNETSADNSTSTSSAAQSTASAAEDSGAEDVDVSTAQAETTEAGDDVSTAQAVSAEAGADVSTAQAAVTAEAGAEVMDVTKMYGTWSLAAIDDGSGLKDVATYAADNSVTEESVMAFLKIDENGYTYATAESETTYSYTATDYGMLVAAEGMDLGVVYDESSDSVMYGVPNGDVTVKLVFMRYEAE